METTCPFYKSNFPLDKQICKGMAYRVNKDNYDIPLSKRKDLRSCI